jgi:hypothetical protein
MDDGTTKPIENVKLGDHVEATDPITGSSASEPVTALHDNQDTALTDVSVATPTGNATIHTTQNHPFWDETHRRWTPASHLAPGTNLRDPTGITVTVARVHNWVGNQDMRNLTVRDIHTYYVIAGTTPVLVHNCPADVPGAGAPKIGPTSGSPNFGDGSISPGEGWEWRGPGAPGTPNRGAWYNPATKETLHPDLAHGDPIGPHYDYRAPDGTFYRIYPDGRVEPK